ncbi:MAG: BufA2 family periplasmic bufferin-type metallophore [Hyphomicrobium sp.]
MKITAKSGVALAATAAALLLSGAVTANAANDKAADGKGHCMGANACKGTSACKTAKNACAGQNACKGTGFTATTAEECAKVEGAKFEAAAAPEKK